MTTGRCRLVGMNRSLTAIVLTLAAAGASAQVPPVPPALNPDAINAEALRRQQELARTRPEPSAPEVTVAPGAEGQKADPGALRFRLNAVRFPDSAYLSAGELAAIAQPFVGREVGFEELRQIVAAVNQRYEARGIVTARATLPPQTIENGVVDVTLVEGRIGATRIEGGSPEGQAVVQRRVQFPDGMLADIGAIETALVRFNRTGDAQLRAAVVPGAALGQTDLVLSLFEPKRTMVDLFVDSNGFETTGRWQGGGVVRVHRLFTGDDRLTASAILSDGVKTGAIAYSAGLGNSGARLGLSYAHGETRVTDGELARFGIRGLSDSLSANVTTLLWADSRTSITGTGGAGYTRSRTRVDGLEVSDTELVSGDLSLSLLHAAPGVQVVATQAFSLVRADEAVLGLARTLALFRFGLSAEVLAGPLLLRARGDAQLTPDSDLPGLLQYQVGGTASARGYAPGLAGGDNGYSIGVEAGLPLGSGAVRTRPYLFADQAGAFSRGGDVVLRSAGAGLELALNQRLTFDAYAAQALTDPLPDLDDTRVVLSMALRF